MDKEQLIETMARLKIGPLALAGMLGLNRQTVWTWTAGKTPVPPWLPSWLAMYEKLNPGDERGL